MKTLEYEPKPQRLRRPGRGIGLAVALTFSLAIVVITAGHGAAPIGLLMYLADPSDLGGWGLPIICGWAGIAALASSCLSRRPKLHVPVRLISVAMLSVSWLLFSQHSDVLSVTLVTSIPLSVVLCFDLLRLFRCKRINVAQGQM
jgi:hypothetical protein